MAVPITLKVSAFALVVMGSYTWYANSIPQIESKPPEELSLEGGNVTPEQLIAAGEKIFREKGQCTTCHAIGRPGGRGPDLAGVGSRAATRKPGTTATAYLVESLLNPGAFVVEGFPNIMPKIDRPPIGLNRSELWATVAFLESQGGAVTVKLDDIPATPRRARRSSPARARASPATRRAASAPARSVPTCPTSGRARPSTT